MTSINVNVPIKLCQDVGNKKYIILCYCGGRIISSFDIYNNHHHHKGHKTCSVIITLIY